MSPFPSQAGVARTPRRAGCRGLAGLALLAIVLSVPLRAQTPATAATASKSPPAAKFDSKTLSAAPSAEDLRPSGPVTITADRSDWVRGQSMLLVGNVVVVSDTMTLRGDQADVQQFPDGNYLVHLVGTPSHVDHPANGPDNPRLIGDSKTMDYDSRTHILTMTTEAHAVRGNDDITGDVIRYHVIERHVEASSLPGAKQVHIVLQPTPASSVGSGETSPPVMSTVPVFPETPSSAHPLKLPATPASSSGSAPTPPVMSTVPTIPAAASSTHPLKPADAPASASTVAPPP
jgi:lipopolysaccharide export system protein LptA